MKRKECESRSLPDDGRFYGWDYQYYARKYMEEKLDLDSSFVKEYFPVSTVVHAILSIYQDLLGVRFEEVKDADKWHEGKSDNS
jgi:Zn-dependent oligopeptidase